MAADLERIYKVRSVDFSRRDEPLIGAANRVQLDGVTLHFCHYSAETRIAFAPGDGFRQFFCLAGAGDVQMSGCSSVVDPARSVVIPPGHETRVVYGDGYQQLVVQFDDAWLRRKAALIRGAEVTGGLSLPRLAQRSAQDSIGLRSIAMSLAVQFSTEGAQHRLVVKELTEALGSAFLLDNGLDDGSPPRDASRADIARLEDYIQAHGSEALTVEAIAAACGVGVRSVFERFRRHHGMTPMAYVRDVRLGHAHRLLLTGEVAPSVMEIAFTCGFSSIGHFARRYREKFGELPSETAKRRRIRLSASRQG